MHFYAEKKMRLQDFSVEDYTVHEHVCRRLFLWKQIKCYTMHTVPGI